MSDVTARDFKQRASNPVCGYVESARNHVSNRSGCIVALGKCMRALVSRPHVPGQHSRALHSNEVWPKPRTNLATARAPEHIPRVGGRLQASGQGSSAGGAPPAPSASAADAVLQAALAGCPVELDFSCPLFSRERARQIAAKIRVFRRSLVCPYRCALASQMF